VVVKCESPAARGRGRAKPTDDPSKNGLAPLYLPPTPHITSSFSTPVKQQVKSPTPHNSSYTTYRQLFLSHSPCVSTDLSISSFLPPSSPRIGHQFASTAALKPLPSPHRLYRRETPSRSVFAPLVSGGCVVEPCLRVSGSRAPSGALTAPHDQNNVCASRQHARTRSKIDACSCKRILESTAHSHPPHNYSGNPTVRLNHRGATPPQALTVNAHYTLHRLS
jgi:hypothetical protein